MRIVWTIKFGKSCKVFYTYYHAAQFARALRLNDTAFIEELAVAVNAS